MNIRRKHSPSLRLNEASVVRPGLEWMNVPAERVLREGRGAGAGLKPMTLVTGRAWLGRPRSKHYVNARSGANRTRGALAREGTFELGMHRLRSTQIDSWRSDNHRLPLQLDRSASSNERSEGLEGGSTQSPAQTPGPLCRSYGGLVVLQIGVDRVGGGRCRSSSQAHSDVARRLTRNSNPSHPGGRGLPRPVNRHARSMAARRLAASALPRPPLFSTRRQSATRFGAPTGSQLIRTPRVERGGRGAK